VEFAKLIKKPIFNFIETAIVKKIRKITPPSAAAVNQKPGEELTEEEVKAQKEEQLNKLLF